MTTTVERFRLGIIGAGIFAEANHYPSISSHGLAGLVDRVAVCDLDLGRAEQMAARYGWRHVYTDAGEMLAREQLDGVLVSVGGPRHPDVACMVLDAGLPVFLEKPSSVDLAGTARIADLARQRDLFVQVGHQKRHGLAYRRALEIVRDTDRFGKIVQIESKQHGFPVFPTFFTCMLEWQGHNLDLIRCFGGDIVEIEAKAHLTDERHGGLSALLRFASGAVGVLAWGTFGGPGQYAERVEIIGDRNRGVIVTNAREVTAYEEDTGETWTSDWNPISRNQSHVFNGYVPQLVHFVESIRAGLQPEPSIHEELKTMTSLFEIAKRAGIPTEWAFISSAP
jgi:predicted dehydrogenase